jgi:hypothetical protein
MNTIARYFTIAAAALSLSLCFASSARAAGKKPPAATHMPATPVQLAQVSKDLVGKRVTFKAPHAATRASPIS